MLKIFTLCYLFLSVYSTLFGQEVQQHEVYFNLDKNHVSIEQQRKLFDWLNTISDSIKRIDVIGHTDFLGNEIYNRDLSQKRAQNVMALIESESQIEYGMSLVSFKGEQESKDNGSALGITLDRKVVVIIQTATSISDIQLEPETKPIEEDLHQGSVEESTPHLLTKMEIGQTLVLKNLNFYPGRHYLVAKALPELERLIQVLKDNPTLEIEIQGHICCKLDSLDGLDVNTRTYTLSANRAEYIFDQLVLAGIDSDRMQHRGFAGSRPLVVPEKDAYDRARNRRVEIKILKK